MAVSSMIDNGFMLHVCFTVMSSQEHRAHILLLDVRQFFKTMYRKQLALLSQAQTAACANIFTQVLLTQLLAVVHHVVEVAEDFRNEGVQLVWGHVPRDIKDVAVPA